MGRGPAIDRDDLLAAAERLIAAEGVAALSIGAVAEAAAVSKGGVQSAFGTRDALIDALLTRWMAADDHRFERLLEEPTPRGRMRAHVSAAAAYDAVPGGHAAGLLASFLQDPARARRIRGWYEARLGISGETSGHDPRIRLAFLACEGAFYLRALDLLQLDDAGWRAVFADIRSLLDDPAN